MIKKISGILSSETAMGIDPPKTQLELISRHLERGEFQLGLDRAKQSSLKFPKSSILCNLQGVFYFKMLLFEEAIISFTRSLDICLDYEEPRNNLAAVHNTIGLSLRDKGKFDESIEHFKKAIFRLPVPLFSLKYFLYPSFY